MSIVNRDSKSFTSFVQTEKDDEEHKKIKFSIEFFPPKTIAGIEKLVKVASDLKNAGANFCSVTWKVDSDPKIIDDQDISSINTVRLLSERCSYSDVILHITTRNQTTETLRFWLEKAKNFGIKTLLVLQGDQRKQVTYSQFTFAIDLVRFIRVNYGNTFDIGVVGHPRKALTSPYTDEQELNFLLQKVNAGADFIITQAFFNADHYIQFVKNCRNIGIRIPIIAGILLLPNHKTFKHIVETWGIEVPVHITEAINNCKNNQEVEQFGVDMATELCYKILSSNFTSNIHLFTLNQGSMAKQLLRNLNSL